MLVLTRRVDESIMIGDEVMVTVVAVKGDHVRIGVSAPRRVSIHRLEIYEEIRRANEEASVAASPDLTALAGLLPSPPATPTPPESRSSGGG